MGDAWKYEHDYEAFKKVQHEIKELHDKNTKDQLETIKEYESRLESLEKQSKEIWNRNH